MRDSECLFQFTLSPSLEIRPAKEIVSAVRLFDKEVFSERDLYGHDKFVAPAAKRHYLLEANRRLLELLSAPTRREENDCPHVQQRGKNKRRAKLS